MKKESRKRESYTPEEYAFKLLGLTRLMNITDKLHADRNDWDIEGDWNSTGVIYFVDSRHQSLFANYTNSDLASRVLYNLTDVRKTG